MCRDGMSVGENRRKRVRKVKKHTTKSPLSQVDGSIVLRSICKVLNGSQPKKVIYIGNQVAPGLVQQAVQLVAPRCARITI